MSFSPVNISLPINGVGSITNAGTSALLSTLTAGKGAAYPTGEFPNQTVTFTNQGTGVAAINPFGSAATLANGVFLPVGVRVPLNMGGIDPATPTIISTGTATVTVEW